MKQIDFSKNIYELTREFPELIEIMVDMGFMGVKNPVVRNTLGRTMTIPDGSKKMGIPLEDVIQKLKENGFEINS